MAARAHALQHELQEARAVAEERSREVAQLREVSVQADRALQQCVAQLQVPAQCLTVHPFWGLRHSVSLVWLEEML